MKKPRLIVVGGFLGAGKTTCILKLSKRLINEGKKIGIVTNDQGSSLVDTNFLASEGLDVLEVTGGCFCCNFDEFAMKVERLAEEGLPDVILAEPVGSCTDLVATIFKPLQFDNARKFDLSPLSVVVDPKRVKKLMMDKGRSLFPDEINYLFHKIAFYIVHKLFYQLVHVKTAFCIKPCGAVEPSQKSFCSSVCLIIYFHGIFYGSFVNHNKRQPALKPFIFSGRY